MRNGITEEVAAIRRGLRRRGYAGSVRNGTGTACGYVHIRGTGELHEFTGTERELLRSLGMSSGGNLCVLLPTERHYWALKLTDPTDLRLIGRQEAVRQEVDLIQSR